MERCKTIEEWYAQFNTGASFIDALSNIPPGYYVSNLEYSIAKKSDEKTTIVGDTKEWKKTQPIIRE